MNSLSPRTWHHTGLPCAHTPHSAISTPFHLLSHYPNSPLLSPRIHVGTEDHATSVLTHGILACWSPQGAVPTQHGSTPYPPRVRGGTPSSLSVGAPRTLRGCKEVHRPHSAWEHLAPSAGAGDVHCPHSAWERPTPSTGAGLCVSGLRVCLICPLIWGSGPCDYSNLPPSSSEVPGGSAQNQPTIYY